MEKAKGNVTKYNQFGMLIRILGKCIQNIDKLQIKDKENLRILEESRHWVRTAFRD